MTSVFHEILRAVAAAMEIPTVIFLVLVLGFAVFSVNTFRRLPCPPASSMATQRFF